MKILVAIANHGTKNQRYLDQLLREYRSMRFEMRIVVLSDVPKHLPPDVQVRVGTPSSNPRSLPFAHRKLFSENRDSYDLFIYSEDDILITQRNIEAFVRVTEALSDDEIAGFLRSEQGPDGQLYCPDAHGVFHWVPGSSRARGSFQFATFSNDHAGCFILTRKQLEKAIRSGGFDVPPHAGRYDILESAASDPYVQCGFTKLICISHLDEFIVPHLPNRYLDYGMKFADLRLQIAEILADGHEGAAGAQLMQTETRLPKMWFSKNYYEPLRKEFLELIPETASTILSIGCGTGQTERHLIETGRRVVAIPLDRLIGAVARKNGVPLAEPGLEAAMAQLGSQRFDCVLCDWILHLWPDPNGLLEWIAQRLAKDGVLLAIVPNLNHYMPLWSRLRGREGYNQVGNHEGVGIHKTTRSQLRSWLSKAGLNPDEMTPIIPNRHQRISRLAGRLGTELFATEIVVCARPSSANGAAGLH